MSYLKNQDDNQKYNDLLLNQISAEIVELESEVSWYSFYQKQQLPRLKEDLEILLNLVDKSSKILEVGSNPPFLLSTITNMGFDIVGVDLNPEIFSKTIVRFQLKVFKSDIEREKLPFPDSTFDFVVFTEVFEHLRIDPIFTVSELHRVLQRDGILLLSTPNLYSLSGIYNFIFKGRSYAHAHADIYDEFKIIQDLGFFGHIREYSFQEVSEFLKKIGFKDIKIIFRSGGAKMWTRLIYKVAPFLKPNMLLLAVK